MIPRERCDYSAIVDRPPLKLPNQARIVVWTIVNLEFWSISRPMARQVLPAPTGEVDADGTLEVVGIGGGDLQAASEPEHPTMAVPLGAEAQALVQGQAGQMPLGFEALLVGGLSRDSLFDPQPLFPLGSPPVPGSLQRRSDGDRD